MRTVNRWLPVLVMLAAACANDDEGAEQTTVYSSVTGTANVKLDSSAVRLTQTSSGQWTLDKVGSLSGNTVTWNVTATKTANSSAQLVVQGRVTLKNQGSAPATIGNVALNLQTKVGNKWKSKSVVVADATQGDAATTIKIDDKASSENLSQLTENAASGTISLTDSTNNAVFSLVPQVTIPAGTKRTLLFQATFDNSVLNLAKNTKVRIEGFVSVGNSKPGGAKNIDINGNGVLDADEARVTTIVERGELVVPALTTGNQTVQLTDTVADITSTGTVTFGNPVFNLGPNGGTVKVTVDGGAEGGAITNCAHLESETQNVACGGYSFPMIAGIDLEACSTITVPGTTNPPCTPGEPGCGWTDGDLETRTQLGWDTTTDWYSAYNTVYGPSFGVVEVGLPGSSGFSMRFSNQVAVQDYLVGTGTPAALDADLSNPPSSSAGIFGGEVLALRLNVDIAPLFGGSANVDFADLRLCAMADSSLNNLTVAQFLGIANTLLGGGSTGHAIADINAITRDLNASFNGGSVSTFAQDHLVNGACP